MFYIKYCCKNCKELNYYDGYFCDIGKNLNEESSTEIEYIIDDIDNEKCELFTLRSGKFWLFDKGEF